MKAMLLAAGRGERMGKLTEQVPKPLLRVGETTLIENNIMQLHRAGIREVIINVHYLRDDIMHHVGDGKKYGVRIHYSVEKNLLGTGGGIQQALPYFDNQCFLILSSDIWTNYPFEKLLHRKTQTAHLVFVHNPDFHVDGDYQLTKEGLVNVGQPKLTYANIGLLHPSLFLKKSLGAYPLTQVLDPAIAENQVTGEHYDGIWFNVGTTKELTRLRLQIQA